MTDEELRNYYRERGVPLPSNIEALEAMSDISRDQQVRIELAREAKDLMENRAFVAAIGVLERQWVAEIKNDATDQPKVHELTAKLRALDAIVQLLRSMMAASRGAHVRGSEARSA